jgi:hypothetical protein
MIAGPDCGGVASELGHSANVPLAHLRNWALDNITRVLNLNPAGASP